MRMTCLLVATSLAVLSSAAGAQQSPGSASEAIGHPPPLPGPPSLAEPSPAAPTPNAPTPNKSEPSKGYTGAYTDSGAHATPYSTGPLPLASTGPGLNTVAPDGVSTKTVKAVPCGTVARETDGFTTCVGIPDQSSRKKRR
jgi:hypothetical protein